MPLPESDFYKSKATTTLEIEIFVIGAVVWLILLLVLFFTDNFWCDCAYKFFSKKKLVLTVDRKGARNVASVTKPAVGYSRVPKTAPSVREDKTQAVTNVSLTSQSTQHSTVPAPLGQPRLPPSLPLASGSISAEVVHKPTVAIAPTAPMLSVAKEFADTSNRRSTLDKKDVTAPTSSAPTTGAPTASVMEQTALRPPPTDIGNQGASASAPAIPSTKQ